MGVIRPWMSPRCQNTTFLPKYNVNEIDFFIKISSFRSHSTLNIILPLRLGCLEHIVKYLCALFKSEQKSKHHEKIELKSETEKKSNYFSAFSHVFQSIIVHDQEIESLLMRWLQNWAFIFHNFVVKVY